jgi:uncharacterized protein (UPF0216 family)
MKAGNIRSTDVFEKMLGKEMLLLNQNVVVRTKSLKELLEEETPSIPNKEGRPYLFDIEALKKAASRYSDYKHAEIMLPIRFCVDMEVSNQCYVREESEADFIKKVAGLERYPFKKGKLWMSKVIAGKIMKEYPTLFQYFYLSYSSSG